ncbi:MAG: hypothetical protein IPG69_11240 [Flavobacteriales bacterium]|nr:hypothetical protein [Flavobacteriales bacterium]
MATRTPLSWIAIIDLALRWHVCISLSVYGGAKWVQFAYGAAIDTPAKDLSDMELMWAFYGRSQEYASIIGVLEIAAGILLLFQRTKLLGVLLGTTILVNVILQDVFYNVLSGALLAALFYQVELLAIAWLDRQRSRSALRGTCTPCITFGERMVLVAGRHGRWCCGPAVLSGEVVGTCAHVVMLRKDERQAASPRISSSRT